MPYTTNPREDSGKYVTSLKNELESRYSGQRSLDKVMRDLYIQKHRIEGAAPATPDVAFRPVGTGFVGLLVDQDVSILGGSWTARVAAVGGAEEERHVSGKLEPAIGLSFQIMQNYAEVHRPLVKDSRIYGRAFAIGPIPAPFFWGMNDELRKLYERLEEASEDDKPARRTDIAAYHQGNFPVVWRRWNAPDVYCTLNDKHQPSEVVYCRKMYASDIVDRFGEDALPNRRRSVGLLTIGTKGYKDSEECDIIDYVNGTYYAVVLPDKDDPRVAHQWEHRMGCTPVTFVETNRVPENEQGWHWAGAALHIRESIHALDDAFTDIRTHIRQWPKSPLVVQHNTELRGQLDGFPDQVTVTGAANEVIALVEGETISRGPMPQMNVDVYQFVDRLTNIVGLVGVRRDALMGQGPSGQSAVHLNVAQTLEKGELAEAKTGLERGLRRAVQLLFRSIIALGEEYPEAPSEIPIGGKLKLSAKDVKGYEDLVQVTIDLNLPVNEGLAVQAASQAIASRLLDPYSARERFLRVENPAEIDERWAEYELFQGALAVALTLIQAKVAGGLQAIAQNPALLKRLSNLPEYALQGIAQAFGAPNVGRSQANVGRTGAGQDMSQLAGTAVRLP